MSYNPKTWNYDHPDCLWEEFSWWVRWPLAAFGILYFGGALLVPVLLFVKVAP